MGFGGLCMDIVREQDNKGFVQLDHLIKQG